MRYLFIIVRIVAYTAVLISLWLTRSTPSWWAASSAVIIALWCSFDQWKKHDAPPGIMRLGVWAETALVVALAFLLQSSELLFLFLSPLFRSCIHLPRREAAMIGFVHVAAAIGIHEFLPSPSIWLWSQLAAITFLGLYTFVLGVLLQQRETARRLLSLAAFEREQRSKDEERVRLAGQLHDRTGQYWVSIIRALDVALAVSEGDPRRTAFMQKAREAAMQGLDEMRQAVRGWHDGSSTPEQWVQTLEQAADRIADITGIHIACEFHPIDWHLFAEPERSAESVSRAGIEAVTNAVKHAHAHTIKVKLNEAGGGVSLIVTDDGVGFDDRSAAGNGIGLAAMHRLAQQEGGQLELAIRPGRGTTLFLTIPYSKEGGTAAL